MCPKGLNGGLFAKVGLFRRPIWLMHGVLGGGAHHRPISCNATEGVKIQSVIPGKTSRADN